MNLLLYINFNVVILKISLEIFLVTILNEMIKTKRINNYIRSRVKKKKPSCPQKKIDGEEFMNNED